MLISQDALDLIIQEETGGRAFYEAREVHTDWPGGASGVTIGCGYDCGYATPAQVRTDWEEILPTSMVDALASTAGVHGSPACALAHELRGTVTVTWDQALKVFAQIDVPRWTTRIQMSLPNTDKLSPDSLGALVSLAFNRGCSFTLKGDRYLEMRNIKDLMDAGRYAEWGMFEVAGEKDPVRMSLIGHQFRSMVRLWPHSEDLRNRRFHEASLFEKGL